MANKKINMYDVGSADFEQPPNKKIFFPNLVVDEYVIFYKDWGNLTFETLIRFNFNVLLFVISFSH